jgi:hypothetical protein
MSKHTRTTAQMTGLWRVKKNKALRWPLFVIDPRNLHHGKTANNRRGGPGFVVDLDQEYERALCSSQERFLEPVPKAEEKAARASLRDPSAWVKPAVNWMIAHGHLDGSARPKRKARAKLAANEPRADAPPSVLPGLADREPKTDPRTPAESPFDEEDADAVEGT